MSHLFWGYTKSLYQGDLSIPNHLQVVCWDRYRDMQRRVCLIHLMAYLLFQLTQ